MSPSPNNNIIHELGLGDQGNWDSAWVINCNLKTILTSNVRIFQKFRRCWQNSVRKRDVKLLEDGGKPVYVTFTGQSPQLKSILENLNWQNSRHFCLMWSTNTEICLIGYSMLVPMVKLLPLVFGWGKVQKHVAMYCYVIPKTNQSKPVFGTGTASNYDIHFILCFSIRGIWEAMHWTRKESLIKAIKQASSVEQTSALEGYHSVVNQFAPKMFAFSYLGLLGRYKCINICYIVML